MSSEDDGRGTASPDPEGVFSFLSFLVSAAGVGSLDTTVDVFCASVGSCEVEAFCDRKGKTCERGTADVSWPESSCLSISQKNMGDSSSCVVDCEEAESSWILSEDDSRSRLSGFEGVSFVAFSKIVVGDAW